MGCCWFPFCHDHRSTEAGFLLHVVWGLFRVYSFFFQLKKLIPRLQVEGFSLCPHGVFQLLLSQPSLTVTSCGSSASAVGDRYANPSKRPLSGHVKRIMTWFFICSSLIQWQLWHSMLFIVETHVLVMVFLNFAGTSHLTASLAGSLGPLYMQILVLKAGSLASLC